MELNQQVCSLELAKRLKELGVKQESLFYYVIDDLEFGNTELMFLGGMGAENDIDISAFTAAELGEMLPATVDGKYGDCTLWYNSRRTNEYHVWYENGREDEKIIFSSKAEADARAKMLVYLLENKLISIK